MLYSPLIQRFNLGEVSPLVQSRTDLAKYPAALKKLENFIPLLQGPVRRRGGSRYIATAGNGGQPVVLIDFAFSETTTFILELGGHYLRVFYQGEPLMSGRAPYQITTPWGQEDLFYDSGIHALKWAQSGDVMYIVCPGQAPRKLMRYGNLDWRIVELPGWRRDEGGETPAEDRPNATAVALFRERLCLAAGQTVYLSQSGAFENFKLSNRAIPRATLTGGGTIDETAGTVTYVSGGTAANRIIVAFPEGEASFGRSGNLIAVSPADPGRGLTRISLGAEGAWSLRASPLSGVLTGRSSDGSLVMTLTVDPDRVSISADPAAGDNKGYIINGSSLPVAADDPVEINVYSEQMDKVEWLCAAGNLLVGTSGGEFSIGETTTSEPLGPGNIKISPETAYGSSPIQALRVGSVVVFMQRAGRKLREFVFDYAGDSYLAVDLTVASEHISLGGITALAWQSEPIETLWAVRGDGQLLGFTYSKEQEMSAWHRHVLGGGGQVSQLAVIPASHGGHDELWLSVRREVGGETVYYIERLEPGHEDGAGIEEAFFVDSGLTLRFDEPVSRVTGLEHLEGLEVAILGDGGVQPRRVVSGGAAALQYPASVVQVGLPYDSVLTTVNFEMMLQDGTAQGRRKRIVNVLLRLLDSKGGEAGPDLENLSLLEYRRGNDRMDTATALFSGDLNVGWPGGWETDGSLTVAQRFALPFTLAAVVADVSIDGKN